MESTRAWVVENVMVQASIQEDVEGLDVGCGPIFSMNTTIGVKITCETLMNSLAIPLLPMQQISTL
jgi:hypothetical protein